MAQVDPFHRSTSGQVLEAWYPSPTARQNMADGQDTLARLASFPGKSRVGRMAQPEPLHRPATVWPRSCASVMPPTAMQNVAVGQETS